MNRQAELGVWMVDRPGLLAQAEHDPVAGRLS